jgi:hypothetical protein
MLSLDRLLTGGALVLLPSSLAVLWRRGQRNRRDFLCCRLLDAVACASRERGPIVSPLARKQRAETSRAFFVTDLRIERGDCRAFRGNSCGLPARTRRLQLFRRLPKSLPVGRFDPTQNTISLALGRHRGPFIRDEIGGMSAGNRTFILGNRDSAAYIVPLPQTPCLPRQSIQRTASLQQYAAGRARARPRASTTRMRAGRM